VIGLVSVSMALISVSMLLADLLRARLDPRIRTVR
jgi:ABC-type dipeptide/oligopeptide/nickel transport system permease component